MAELLSPKQVDVITGDYLGNPDSANWAMRLAPVLDIEHPDDSVVDVTLLVFDGDSGEDYAADSDPDSLGTKRKGASQPQMDFTFASSDAFASWKQTFKDHAHYIQSLVSACSPRFSLTAKEQRSLRTCGQQMICDLCNVSPAVWSNNAWKQCLEASGFLAAFWSLEHIHQYSSQPSVSHSSQPSPTLVTVPNFRFYLCSSLTVVWQ
jgi:hypothetical protein